MDDVIKEVRRQGKAAVAAQASAEACLEAVQRLEAKLGETPKEDPTQFLKALLPVFDALDRIAAWTPPPKGRAQTLLDRLRPTDSGPLFEGVRLLHAQLNATLARLDVEVDRRIGVGFDPEAHRAVEVRRDPKVALETVTEVVSAGYRYQGQRIREADVVVTRPPEGSS